MDPITLHAFHPVTGAHLGQIPYSAIDWKDSISDTGSMSATLPDTPALRSLDLARLLREYGSIWAAKMGSRILHAGYLTHWKLDDDGSGITLDIGGGWTLWEKRLVLNHQLATEWKDGTVIIDEDHPPGAWVLTIDGSYSDIARGLVVESLKWGTAPYTVPERQGGGNTRTYNCWDLATVSERLGDLADLADGPEIRFDPRLSGDMLHFALNVGNPEIVDRVWTWNCNIPGHRVMLTGIDADGDAMTTAVYATGGKDDDKLLVAHSSSGYLTGQGWPVLQTANTSHATVSVLATLQDYLRGDLATGDRIQPTFGVKCTITNDVHIGDHINLRIGDGFAATIAHQLLGTTILPLKVTDLSGSADSEWLDLQCREL